MLLGMFEVSGTHFEKGVFEIYLDKRAPKPLNLFMRIGPITGRLVGLAMLAFSFLFSTSRAPIQLMLERGIAQTTEQALKYQQDLGYFFFFIAVVFYMTIFFFRQEKMSLMFDKGSKLFSVIREPMFRFSSTQRGHVPFQDIQKIVCVSPDKAPETEHGKIVLHSDKMPPKFQQIEFKVLSREQFEFFPLNIERMLGK